MSRAKNKPTRVGLVIAHLVESQEGASRAEQRRGALVLRTFAAFEKLPPTLVKHAEPIALRGGVLTVMVDEPVWLTELSFLREEMIERLNRALGKIVVREIHLRQGRLSRRRRFDPPKKTEPPVLPPGAKEEVEAWAGVIADPILRASIERAMRWALAPKKKR